jgi:hypothetical protein
MMPGVPQRATHDYKCNGTSSLYAALDITTGKVIGQLHCRPQASLVGTWRSARPLAPTTLNTCHTASQPAGRSSARCRTYLTESFDKCC